MLHTPVPHPTLHPIYFTIQSTAGKLEFDREEAILLFAVFVWNDVQSGREQRWDIRTEVSYDNICA